MRRKLPRIETLVRRAYTGKGPYSRITIKQDGRILATLGSGTTLTTNLGHIGDCRAVHIDNTVLVYNRHILIHAERRPA